MATACECDRCGKLYKEIGTSRYFSIVKKGAMFPLDLCYECQGKLERFVKGIDL